MDFMWSSPVESSGVQWTGYLVFMSFYVVQSRWSPVDWVLSLFIEFLCSPVQMESTGVHLKISPPVSNPPQETESRWSPVESSGVQVESSGVQWSPLESTGLQVDSVGEGKVLLFFPTFLLTS